MSKENGAEHYEGVRECPDYVADFFDLDEICQRFPDLGVRLEKMPALPQIDKVFTFFSLEFPNVYSRIQEPNETNLRILKHKNYQRIFYEKLIDIFETKVEPRIAVIKKSINEMGLSEKQFAPGWEDRLRYDVAWAFLIHFRQKRHESDYDPKTGEQIPGKQLDYIRHPLRVALSETRPVSVGLLDETTVELGILHDVVEDFGRGFFGEKGINLPKTALDYLKGKVLDQIDDNQNPSLNESGDKMSRLISIISKADNDEMSREQHLIELLGRLTYVPKLPEGRTPEDRTEWFLNNLKCFIVKILDRLDNEQTSHYLKTKKPVIFEAMMNETSYVFYICAIYFGMTSAADWITDFIELIDKSEWRPFFNLRKEVIKAYDPEAALIRFFQTEMEKRAGIIGFSPIYGQDYAIISRPRALRHRKDAIKRKSRRAMPSSVSVSGAKAMSQPFQHNVIFVPSTNDSFSNQTIADVARQIFVKYFEPLDVGVYKEDRDTPFGSMFEYATDRRKSVGSDRSHFGDVVYAVFDSPSDMRKHFYGLIHSAVIDGDEMAMAYMIEAFRRIADRVVKIQSQFSCLDSISQILEMVVKNARRLAFETVDAPADSDLPKIPGTISPNVISELKKLIEFNVYALFPPMVKASVKISRRKNGVLKTEDFGEIDLPLGSNVAYTLFNVTSTSLFYRIIGCSVGPNLDNFRYVIQNGDDVNIYVDEDDVLGEESQLLQIETVRRNLVSDILPWIAKTHGLDLTRSNFKLAA
ncbi:MAG: hypothetical protein US89_C0016G0008 [Candidatus Peregrinibacteria bacterium GW2011_GWF2_38_29]|nr:MAG: hypothetical protein US89_C0016G0008 [Candidatus Peregrinibacteria bacterium GW2011_GWF2_38_29]HBB03121.1 hypothetical protein [Candidatus Peregrinibacteria bacterium]